MEKQAENGMKGVVAPDKLKGCPTKKKSAHNESQLDSINAVTKLQNLIGATLATKPVVPKPTRGKQNDPKEEVAPGDAQAQSGATASGTDEVQVVEDTNLPPVLPFLPPLPEPLVTSEEEVIPAPLTDTNTKEEQSKVVPESVDDD